MNHSNLSLSLMSAVLRSHGPQEGQPTASQKPFTITVSREVGALGNTVAREVGRRLNWPVYDQEIIDQISREMGVSAERLQTIDERPVHWLEEALTNLLTEHHLSTTTYLRYLVGTIRGLGILGKCLIVGRGAQSILRPETTLRVRLVADLEDRIRVIRQRKGLSEKEAKTYITRIEGDRVQFVKNHFRRDPANPHEYDLVLNTSRLSVEECADIIVETLHRRERHGVTAGPAEARTALAPAQ